MNPCLLRTPENDTENRTSVSWPNVTIVQGGSTSYPEIGRWISRDSVSGQIAKPQSLNRYQYCFNNPLIYVDPDGNVITKSDIPKAMAIMHGEAGGQGNFDLAAAVVFTLNNRADLYFGGNFSKAYDFYVSQNNEYLKNKATRKSAEKFVKAGKKGKLDSYSTRVYNRYLSTIKDMISGKKKDNTGGATHFYSDIVETQDGAVAVQAPDWTEEEGAKETKSMTGRMYKALQRNVVYRFFKNIKMNKPEK